MTTTRRNLLGDSPIRRLRQWLNDHKAVTITASALGMIACIWIAYGRLTGDRVEVPATSYRCAGGHTWTAQPSRAPTCPTCDDPGITESHYHCRSCNRAFLGLEMRKLGVGRMDFRAAGTVQWRPFPPQRLRCPHCRTTGPLKDGPFVPKVRRYGTNTRALSNPAKK